MQIMKPNSAKITALALSLLAMILFASCSSQPKQAAASDGKTPCIGCSVDGKTTPRTVDGHPDLNGYWNTPRGAEGGQFANRSTDGSILYEFSVDFDEVTTACIDDSCQVPNQPPYKPEYMEKVREIAKTSYTGTSVLDPGMACRPAGLPRAGIGATQIVQTPQLTAILYEGAPSSIFRIIYTDGRPHPADFESSYMGHSIGHWEGDTLVVDTVGFNDDSWLGGWAHGRAKYTSIHSEQEHVVERFSRDGNTLTYEVTVEDPVMFTRPWVLPARKVRMSNPGDYLLETICTPSINVITGETHMIKPTEEDPGQLFLGAKSNAIKPKATATSNKTTSAKTK